MFAKKSWVVCSSVVLAADVMCIVNSISVHFFYEVKTEQGCLCIGLGASSLWLSGDSIAGQVCGPFRIV
jgi:hypothetical protein